MAEKRKIKVLVIDDSIVVRRMLSRILNDDPEIEVVDTAENPYDAEGKILKQNPDVLTLDIEMPKMDGLTFLKILMEKRPMPVVVMSSLSQQGSSQAMEALQLGAIDVLAKPYGPYSVGNVGPQLIEKVKAAAISRMRPRIRPASGSTPVASNGKERTPEERSRAMQAAHIRAASQKKVETLEPISTRFHSRQVVLLGASTGGTEALKEVLIKLPPQMPGICIVQHIPPYFSKAFADRLDTLCALHVKEAEDGDIVEPGKVLIAPGDYHMLLKWDTTRYKVVLKQGPMVWHQRPAVDILFKTAAECAGKYATAALLTGMGKDGAEGLLKLKEQGATTYAQDEATCVVFGMPKTAMELGAAKEMLPLPKIAPALLNDVARKF
ncbi:MAG: chemotaxis response regulator protein-glutamate methylesterase [Opitutales bacterium]|nr:chemotaxis response regulator protein-glutamate methylesterase [Opitutales bacterium]